VVYNTQNLWTLELCPLSDILNKYKTQRCGNCYLFPRSGEGRETYTLLGPLERVNINSCPHLKLETGSISETLCLALTLPTSGGRSVGIVRSWTKVIEFFFFVFPSV
jgi:hypothetical protein